MTLKNDLISKISDKNVNIHEFVQIVINDGSIRDEIVNQMLNNKNIMVYYHSYYIISKASELKPEMFYKYWDEFVSLLNHENSYHRDFGLTLTANLTEVDKENKFSSIFEDYFKCINDSKFMTARHCIQNTAKILANKHELKDDVINMLLDIDNRCNFPQKQKALLKSDVIGVFDEFYGKITSKERINEFVKTELDSISPKTKKRAREFILKYEF
ncbi:MAG: hypothetical protein HZC47_05405 [Methanobacterium sp.]|uniref:hypothetical protein n=1 Tax=Methanobacterium sp. TaxID=2164 RepID=UPI003D64D2E4|nr:hypothetical protein [Methanobacterium sp.]